MSASRIEILRILAEIEDSEGQPMALVTVVNLEGSGYRRTGARMLVHPDGRWTGAISGGCLEGNALRRSRMVMQSGEPELVVYDTRTDDAAREIGASLGCNGILQVWIEPVTESVKTHLKRIASAFEGNQPVWLKRNLEMPDEMQEMEDDPGLREGLQEMAGNKFLTEKISPVIRLLIFGAGYDVIPLTEIAQQMGWRVVVTDDCVARALPSRFPAADQVAQLEASEIIPQLQPDSHSAAILISHNFDYDLKVLKEIYPTPVAYIGILGPKSRFQRLDTHFAGKLSADSRVHAPIGLDIGSETPYGIAMAIATEIQSVLSERNGGFLRDRKGTIHLREEEKV